MRKWWAGDATLSSQAVKKLTAAVAAHHLGTSERSLRRHLSAEGTSFRELVEETREALALQHIDDPRLPISEIALVLGFSEPSAFHRAFKRWTGATPAAFRKRQR